MVKMRFITVFLYSFISGKLKKLSREFFQFPVRVFSISLVFLASCVYTPVKGRSEKNQIDKRYLSFWYKHQIIPAFENYKNNIEELNRIAGLYKNGGSVDMELLRDAYKSAIISLQDIIIFDKPYFFYDTYSLYSMSSMFPLNKKEFERLASNDISADEILNQIKKGIIIPNRIGFASIDYILFGEHNPTSAYMEFLKKITSILYGNANEIYLYYNNNVDKFINNTDFGVNGSLSIIINNLLNNLEVNIRTSKVGYPIGIFGLNYHDVSPNISEALYSDMSTILLRQSINALRNFYFGIPYKKSYKTTGDFSFRNMLIEYIPKHTSDKIIEKIDNEFSLLEKLLENENASIPDLIKSEHGLKKLKDIYSSLQRLVGLLKTNSVNALGLTITYSDGEEGD